MTAKLCQNDSFLLVLGILGSMPFPFSSNPISKSAARNTCHYQHDAYAILFCYFPCLLEYSWRIGYMTGEKFG